MSNPEHLETVNKLYLELSTIASAQTWEQIGVRKAVNMAAIDADRLFRLIDNSVYKVGLDEAIDLRNSLVDLAENLKDPKRFNPHYL